VVAKLLQPVEMAERCFLHEVLYWLAFKRLPLAQYSLNGDQARFSDEKGDGYGAPASFREAVTSTECALANLPPNPEYLAEVAGRFFYHLDHYDEKLSWKLKDEDQAEEHRRLEAYRRERVEAVEYYQRLAEWPGLCDSYLEYFKSRLFVDLREVKIQGSAIEIPGRNEEEVNAYMEAQNVKLTDQPVVKVPHDSWIFSNID
jgi:hypothetical protein